MNARDGLTIGRALQRAVSTWPSDRAAIIAVPAPTVAFEKVAWDSYLRTADDVLAGIGVGVERSAEGSDRLRTIAAVPPFEFDAVGLEGAEPFAPRFIGGVAFEPELLDEPWRAFGAARFVVPRWTLLRRHGVTTLQLALKGSRDAIRAESDRVFETYQQFGVTPSPTVATQPHLVPSNEDYSRGVEGALRTIAAGLAEKIVLSRDLVVEGDGDFDVASILGRLQATDPTTTFLFRSGDRTFLGATPERLVGVEGTRVETEAVAGSAPAFAPECLDTPKNRREHDAVVEWIRDRLGQHAGDVKCEAVQVRTLPNVLHLVTPIEATLRDSAHVLDVAASLFPTPAVAGTPLDVACCAIRETERRPRGWYAGAVGSFDVEGNGELFVALRCALIEGRRATVFAGAGIVEGSDPAAEFEETAVKAETMLRALGVRE